jgi:hypothetical protein
MAGIDFASFMAARNEGRPGAYKSEAEEFNTVKGWSEYEGPMPGKNPMSNGEGSITCPVCHGDGFDLQEGNDCRECGGSGKVTPTTTARAPEVAKHDYPNNATTVPFMGSLDLDARCPSCSTPTSLHASSKRGQALWRCARCGPLANLDAHPEINPFAPPGRARLARVAKTGSARHTARIMPMLASIAEANDLSPTEALALALATVRRYPEGR